MSDPAAGGSGAGRASSELPVAARPRAELPPRGSAARRRLGLLLAVFGATGLLLIGAAFFVAARPVAAETGPFGIEAQRRQLVAFLDASRDAIESAERAARDADNSLGTTAVAAGSAATLMNDLSSTLSGLASSLRITVFGTQPFAAAADDMERVARQAGTVAGDLDVAASSVRLAAEDMDTLAEDLAGIQEELAVIRASVADPIEAEGWRLLVAATLLWLAIPAAVSLWLGVQWLRPARRPPATGRPEARDRELLPRR